MGIEWEFGTSKGEGALTNEGNGIGKDILEV
jgi:hypothetical protein